MSGSKKKFNLESLFPSDHKSSNRGKLDMNTLFGNEEDDSNSYKFDSKILLSNIHKRKKKLDATHNDMFRGCCESIKGASEAGYSHIHYDVPKHVIDCNDYKPSECLEFIKEKLNEQKLNIKIISRTRMYISWEDIEEKLENNENES